MEMVSCFIIINNFMIIIIIIIIIILLNPYMYMPSGFFFSSLRKHAYSNIFKILQPEKETF